MRKLFLLSWLCCIAAIAMAQTKTITGKVTDQKTGTPLPGVSISVKGTQLGTTSKEDGSFSITIPSDSRALVFSYLGYGDEERSIERVNSLNVSLSEGEGRKLDEVVVVAYGTQQKKEITGASTVVKSKDIANIPRTSVDQILQGKVAGLQSITPTGQPGAIQQIRIRGIGSITAGAAPLWVVDGVPVNTGDFSRNTTTTNALSGLNPNDIESVTVLKDASATSIYGSRAANGVILVTTKKGKAGKSRIRVDSEVGFSELANYPDNGKVLNAAQWLELTREGLVNVGATQAQIDNIMNGYGVNSGVDTDWLDLVTRRGGQQQLNVSASGGNDKTTYFLSLGYFKQEAPVIASDFKRYSGTLNLTNKFSERFNIGTNLSISSVNQHTPSGGGAFANPIDAVYFLRPTQNPYNSDGTLNISRVGNVNFPADYNPLYIAENDDKSMNNLKIFGNINAELKLLKNLRFTSRYGVDYFNMVENVYNNPFHGDGRNAGGRIAFNYTKVFNWVFTNQLNFRQGFLGEDLILDAMVGYEAQESKEKNVDARKEGFPPTLELNAPTVAATPALFIGVGADFAFESLFSNMSLNYKNKYVLTGSFRRDGSSRFGINNRYGHFWSVGAAWNLDQEEFMKNISFISAAKIRGSYGVNGNGDLANYGWRPAFSYGFNYNGQPGGTFNQIGNIDLTWELNKPFNIGVDLALFNNRINLTVDYYNRKTSDLLLNRPLPPSIGFTGTLQNVGAMKNSGIEVTFEATAVRTRNLTWVTGFNFSNNKNKITRLPGGEFPDGSFYRKEGKDFQSFYVRQFAGVDPQTGDPLWYVDATKQTTTKIYTDAQRIIYSSASPKYFGSFNNTLTYKDFSLDFQFYYNFGNHVRDQWAGSLLDGQLPSANKYAINLRRWQKPGDITDVPKYQYNVVNSSSSFSTRVLYKGDFIRLRNITLGYRVPQSILNRIGFASGQFYVRGFNFFTKTFDERLTFDPETGVQSLANLTIPLSRTITFGLNFEF
ncbi:MAG TPA: TonB-dependent receptor [Chitinophagaceae bacterium]